MINKLIETALQNRLMVVVLTLGVLGLGYWSFEQVPVDAFPDATPTVVQVFTTAPGLSPVDVEKQISYPIEISMYGIPKLARVQSTSVFGLSRVNIYFEDNTDYFFARQLVLERLQQARESIPPGLGPPRIGPMTTGLGQVMMYVVTDKPGGEDYSLTELREAQDWIVKPMLRTSKGVTGVLSVGGYEKQYQVRLDIDKMLARDISVQDVKRALESNNRNVGASFLERGGEEFIIRGYGWIDAGEDGLEDLRNIVLEEHDGTPVTIADVAEVDFGGGLRRGALVANGQEAVGGFVMKLIGSNTQEVLETVDEKIRAINTALPDGLEVEPFYSQAQLVDRAVATVANALLLGAVLVLVFLYLFLGNIRSTLIIMAALPFSSLVAFIGMHWLDMSANLMSLGGLAIGIGIMGDGATVMLENVFRHLEEREDQGLAMVEVVQRAAQQVARPIAFSFSIIVIVFLPLFSLQGTEGKLFKPMTYTFVLAIAGALLLSLVVVPVLTSLMFSKDSVQREPRLVSALRDMYRPVVSAAVERRGWVLGVTLVLFVGALSLFPMLGTEFMPTLREGTIVVRSVLPPGANLDSSVTYTGRIQDSISEFPEVTGAYSRVGRAEVGGDPEPVNVVFTVVNLKPLDQWDSGRDYEGLQGAIAGRLDERVPGLANNVSQVIQLRTDELLSGVRAQVVISVFGEDLDELAGLGQQIADIAKTVPGAVDVRAQQQGGKNQILIRPDRDKLARLGVSTDEFLEFIEIGIGGETSGQVFEGIRRFPIFVRLQQDQRDQLDQLKRLPIRTADGALVPLSQVAKFEVYQGPKMISRNKASRRLYVQLNVRGRDMGSVVSDIRRRIDQQIDMPAGYFTEYGGQFENQQRAMDRLYLVVPLTLALIFLMLFAAFDNIRHALLIFMNIPFATIGGLVALWLGGLYLSVPAAVGFIAVFGVAVLNGNVLVEHINQLRNAGMSVVDAVVTGGEHRLRPVLMTATTTIGGLVPLLLAEDIGSNVQRPLAAVVIGGLVTSTILTLIVLPAMYSWFGSHD
ncbi:MAG: efflux RND transporter permease subunit [Myxococcota bacterium]